MVATFNASAFTSVFASIANFLLARPRIGVAPSGRWFAAIALACSTLGASLGVSAQAISWGNAASMTTARTQHTSTLLPSGKVLVTGGSNAAAALNSPELYDPASNTWSAAGGMLSERYRHTATPPRCWPRARFWLRVGKAAAAS